MNNFTDKKTKMQEKTLKKLIFLTKRLKQTS